MYKKLNPLDIVFALRSPSVPVDDRNVKIVTTGVKPTPNALTERFGVTQIAFSNDGNIMTFEWDGLGNRSDWFSLSRVKATKMPTEI